VYSDLTTAKTQLEANLRKLQVRALKRENAMLRSEVTKVETQGNDDEALAYLREVQALAQERRKLRARGKPGGS